MGLSIKVTVKGSDALKSFFKGIKDVPAKVMVQAINKTLTGVKTDVIAEASAILTARESKIEKAIEIKEASLRELAGIVSISGKSLPLIAFTNRQTDRGVEVQIKHGRTPRVIPNTFYVQTKVGGAGVFWREWHGVAAGGAKKKFPFARLPDRYRYPIRQLFSSSVADVAGDRMEVIIKQAGDRLQTNLEDELNSELSKL